MKRLAIVSAVIGASIFVGVILLVYWVLSYWPQGVQWDRVKSRTEQLFILGSVFIIAGGLISMYATKNVGQWRKMLLSLLSVALVLILGVSLVVPSQKRRHAESRYAFTTDWVSRNEEIWARQLEKFKGLPHIRALEIGSYEGRSAL